MKPTVSEIRMGALYNFAASRKLSRATVEALLVSRCKLSAATAHQLAGHWFGTEKFRAAIALAEGRAS